jgi:hypothetical protein
MSKCFSFGMFFSVNFFIPKLMKIRWSSLVFGSFAPHFQIKLSIHASNLNSRFVSMSEVELILLTWVLTPNFNTMDLVKKFEKIQKLHIQILTVTLNHEPKKKKWKKSEKPRFYGQNKLFFENPTHQPLGCFNHMPLAPCRS